MLFISLNLTKMVRTGRIHPERIRNTSRRARLISILEGNSDLVRGLLIESETIEISREKLDEYQDKKSQRGYIDRKNID